MEHERGAFKVNRETIRGAVKNDPERALSAQISGLDCLQARIATQNAYCRKFRHASRFAH